MNFEKYSKEKFASLGLNTPAARTLADELQVDVNKVIQPAVGPAFLNVVEQLNAQGHNLKITDDSSAGDVSFRDEPIKDQCCLRLSCDVMISAGYAHDSKLSREVRDSIANRIQTTWDRYIDAVHRFIALNTSVIVGVAAVASFLAKLHGKGDTSILLEHKGYLFAGLVCLMISLLFEVTLRIWVQQFMEYEVMQPRDDMDKYYGGRIHYTLSYRLSEWNYRWQYGAARVITILAPLSFLAGLSLSLLFLYSNLQ
jgi:hypothetical protein